MTTSRAEIECVAFLLHPVAIFVCAMQTYIMYNRQMHFPSPWHLSYTMYFTVMASIHTVSTLTTAALLCAVCLPWKRKRSSQVYRKIIFLHKPFVCTVLDIMYYSLAFQVKLHSARHEHIATTHKCCVMQFHSVASVCLIEHRSGYDTYQRYVYCQAANGAHTVPHISTVTSTLRFTGSSSSSRSHCNTTLYMYHPTIDTAPLQTVDTNYQ